MASVALFALGLSLGALPFSAWLARAVGADIRSTGDGNPGATNAWRAGGAKIGLPALLLDFLKGALPVAWGVALGLRGWALVPVILAPPLGHAFSPLLGFRGGKAVATTFGVWTGATAWLVPTVLGGLMTLSVLLKVPSAWAVMASGAGGLVLVSVYLRDPALAVAFTLNLGLLAWRHRHDLLPPRSAT
ncbi:MAG: glycerol-3-phosphate acyltransferase [Candidatus Bipolaricaulaceae bacterium]